MSAQRLVHKWSQQHENNLPVYQLMNEQSDTATQWNRIQQEMKAITVDATTETLLSERSQTQKTTSDSMYRKCSETANLKDRKLLYGNGNGA